MPGKFSDDEDGVRSWLAVNKLSGIADILITGGVNTMAELLDITEDAKEDLAEEGLKKMKFRTLLKAINVWNQKGGVGAGGGAGGVCHPGRHE